MYVPKKRKGPGRPRKRGRPRTTPRRYYYKRRPQRKTSEVSRKLKDIEKLVQYSEREWNKKKPKTRTHFDELMITCGPECFLDRGITKTNEYAVCPKCSNKDCYCFPDCDGLLHAKIKANKSGKPFIEQVAQELSEELNCDWDTAIKYLLLDKYSKTLSLLI